MNVRDENAELRALPMTELLRRCYLASGALGPEPDDDALERYERLMSELDRRENAGMDPLRVPDRLEVETHLGTLVATTERSYEDSRVVEVVLRRPDGTEGQVALVEVVSGELAHEGESPLHTYCWDGTSEEYCACVEVDPEGEAMRCCERDPLADLLTGKWRVHLVMPGDRYGRNELTYEREIADRHGSGLPLVEFYDTSQDHLRSSPEACL